MCLDFLQKPVLIKRNIKPLLTIIKTFSTIKSRETPNPRSDQKWESVVGLEIHAQIASETKLFSGSATKFGAPPNTQVSFFDAGHPGTLPVLNKRCVEAGILTALALGCTINKKSVFDRKHYFYADLPVGYQITQQRLPLAVNGKLSFITSNPNVIKKPYISESRIKQIQLEQDSGKSIHDVDAGLSLIDLNRAGMPLMEIVFDPDLKTGEEAASLIRELHLILTSLKTCDCKMEEGSLRVDANVSVNKPGDPLGVRTEIKNLGSIRAVANAIEYEIARQIKVLENGGIIENETLSFDAKSKETISMRDKEKVQDYRFMPEPNLPPLLLSDELDDPKIQSERINIDQLRRQIAELPADTRKKLMTYDLPLDIIVQLQHNDLMLRYFNYLINDGRFAVKDVTVFLLNTLMTSLGNLNISANESNLSEKTLAEVLYLRKTDTISRDTSQLVLDALLTGDARSPKEIVEQNKWNKITDKTELEIICKEIISKNEKLFRNAKPKDEERIFHTLVNYVKKTTDNRADVKLVMEIMKVLLRKNKV